MYSLSHLDVASTPAPGRACIRVSDFAGRLLALQLMRRRTTDFLPNLPLFPKGWNEGRLLPFQFATLDLQPIFELVAQFQQRIDTEILECAPLGVLLCAKTFHATGGAQLSGAGVYERTAQQIGICCAVRFSSHRLRTAIPSETLALKR